MIYQKQNAYIFVVLLLFSHAQVLLAQAVIKTGKKSRVSKELGISEDTIDEVTGGIVIEDIIEPTVEYHYASFSKDDPFIAPVILDEKPLFDMEEVPIVSPLQNFELSALKLVGIWQSDANVRKGLIMTEDKEGVIIKVGDPIGRHGGKVLVISDSSITVREIVYSSDGLRQFEDIELLLQKSNEGEASLFRRPPISLSAKATGQPGTSAPANANGVNNLGDYGTGGVGIGSAPKATAPDISNDTVKKQTSPNISPESGQNPSGIPQGNMGNPNAISGVPPEVLKQIIEATQQQQTAPFPYEGGQ